jgi:hypothetical protein
MVYDIMADQPNSASNLTVQKLKNLFQKPRALIISAAVLFFIAASVVYIYSRINQNNSNTSQNTTTAAETSQPKPSEKMVTIDAAGQEITKKLQSVGIDMGFISSENLESLNINFPINYTGERKVQVPENTAIKTQPLSDLIKAPETAEKRNLLEYPKYNISAPIQYAVFEDIFERDGNGEINFNKPVDNNPIESPVQKKLQDGVVHLPFSPQPGEMGNSYIIGHSSNFSSVKSNYNFVFKPIERTSQPGEEFFIYDHTGRKLKFKVFEAKAIQENDVTESYKNFPNRRVVTLQASILEKVNGKNVPTKRWLTRGELVVE